MLQCGGFRAGTLLSDGLQLYKASKLQVQTPWEALSNFLNIPLWDYISTTHHLLGCHPNLKLQNTGAGLP